MTADPAATPIRTRSVGHLDLDEQDATIDVSLVFPAENWPADILLQVTEGNSAAHALLNPERVRGVIHALEQALAARYVQENGKE